MKLASDMDSNEFIGAQNPDGLLHVRFYSKPVEQPFLSEKEGRPIFKDADFVKIHTPGNQYSVIDTFVTEEHKSRFPMQWARYQNGKQGDDQMVGTPLSQWPMLTASQAEELKALKFFTVEMIAGASDERIATVGMSVGMAPAAFREKARRYLTVAKDTADSDKVTDELKKRDDQIALMQKQIEELLAAQKQGGTLHVPKK